MGFSIKKANGLFAKKIGVGVAFGVEEFDAWIELREPTEDEAMNFKSNDPEFNKRELKKLWKDCLVNHNFDNEEGSPASNQEVIDAIKKKGWLVAEIVVKWNDSLPFTMRSEQN